MSGHPQTPISFSELLRIIYVRMRTVKHLHYLPYVRSEGTQVKNSGLFSALFWKSTISFQSLDVSLVIMLRQMILSVVRSVNLSLQIILLNGMIRDIRFAVLAIFSI